MSGLRTRVGGGIACQFCGQIEGAPLIWDKNNQELWDKIVDTIIVNDPNKQLA